MGIRISEMEEATTFGADDYVPIVTNGTNKKALGQKIKDFIAGFFVAKDDNSRLITSLGQTFTDCNAVMTSGMYSANMGAVSNAPAGTMVSSNGGQLIVTQRASDVRVFQTLFVYVGNGSKTEIYVRAQNNATSFSDWRHITAADGISFDNTGTGLSASNTQSVIEEVNEKANTALQISNGSTTAPWGTTASIARISQFKSMLIIGGRLNKGFMVLIPSGTNEYVILSNIDSCITGVSVTSSTINITISSSGYGSNIIINTVVLI